MIASNKPKMTHEEESRLRLECQKFHESPNSKNHKVSVRGFVMGTYLYFRKGFRMREVTSFPDGSIKEGAWEHTADATWLPYGLYRNRPTGSDYNHCYFIRSASHADFPGALIHKPGTYTGKMQRPGPNRVNP